MDRKTSGCNIGLLSALLLPLPAVLLYLPLQGNLFHFVPPLRPFLLSSPSTIGGSGVFELSSALGFLVMGATLSLLGLRWGLALAGSLAVLATSASIFATTGLEFFLLGNSLVFLSSTAVPALTLGVACCTPEKWRGVGIAIAFSAWTVMIPKLWQSTLPSAPGTLDQRIVLIWLTVGLSAWLVSWIFFWRKPGIPESMDPAAGRMLVGSTRATPQNDCRGDSLSLESHPAWAAIVGFLFTAFLLPGLRSGILAGEIPAAGRILDFFTLWGPVAGAIVAGLAVDLLTRGTDTAHSYRRAVLLTFGGLWGASGLMGWSGGRFDQPYLVIAAAALGAFAWGAWMVSLLSLMIGAVTARSTPLVAGIAAAVGVLSSLAEADLVSATGLTGWNPQWRFLEFCCFALVSLAPIWSLSRETAALTDSGLRPAGFWRRAGAAVIDCLVFLLILAAIRVNLDSAQEPIPAIGKDLIALFLSALLLIGYLLVAEGSGLEGTLGKLAFRVRVGNLGGGRAGIPRATLRHICKLWSVPFAVGFTMAAFSSRKQALHDVMSNCLVLVRSPKAKYVPAPTRKSRRSARVGSLLGLRPESAEEPLSAPEPDDPASTSGPSS